VLRLILVSTFLVLIAVPAFADDDTQALIATCGAADLPSEKLDDCLEQVRVAAETDSSPELAALQARLEQRLSAAAHAQPDTQPNAPAVTNVPAPPDAPPDTNVPPDSNNGRRDTGAVGQTVLHPYDPNASLPPDDDKSGDGR
jgi:hypothetical protein